jgi:predicted glycogen debranching enzyme
MERLLMTPAPGARLLHFVGDRIAFALHDDLSSPAPPEGWRAFLRTNLGRAAYIRQDIIQAHSGRLGLAARVWRDIPMQWRDGAWRLECILTEVGFFKAKAYAMDARGWQHWPDGPDCGVSVHPDAYRTANTIYCAFPRMFGPTRTARSTAGNQHEQCIRALDQEGYTVLPPSGTLRHLVAQLPHIIDTLGCRIVHLLPINPTPTTYARFGRFGSPYACQDLLAIDPALVDFDKRSTGIEQFRELTYATHMRGGRVFLDVVINHTGWGSTLQENRPDWFVRQADGTFVSPGAWGVTWEDLVELQHRNPELWEALSEVFVEWCRRGVDGFRCDAGYKIPVPAWRYITARVQEEFPDTIFLLEGLGGAWETTEALLTEGGMHWAYSELFQNYAGDAVATYLDYSLSQSQRLGIYVNYSETHDNNRLAQTGPAWSLLRNRLCALSSVNGAFGFTCGVEWLAREKIDVHESRGLAWDNPENLIPELARLNRLLAEHPCFFDGATVQRLSATASPVVILSRVSNEGVDRLLILINTDVERAHRVTLPVQTWRDIGQPTFDLLSETTFRLGRSRGGQLSFTLGAGACLCLADAPQPHGLNGDAYRLARAQAAWAVGAVSHVLAGEAVGPFDWRALAREVSAEPLRFLTALSVLDTVLAQVDFLAAVRAAAAKAPFPNVVVWHLLDTRRITLVPHGHWLVIDESVPFRATLAAGRMMQHAQSVPMGDRHIAYIAPGFPAGDAQLSLQRFTVPRPSVQATLRFLSPAPDVRALTMSPDAVAHGIERPHASGLALLTNGRGGMARMQVDLGQVQSKYDCVLGANLHPTVPVDRHLFVKRLRVWVVADGFITSLNGSNLIGFAPGPPATWRFVANAGDGRAVEVHLIADMLQGKNVTVLTFNHPSGPPAFGTEMPETARVSLTVRLDIVDRNFHAESHRNPGAEHHFGAHTRPLSHLPGFEFTPAADRVLRVWASTGAFHMQPEWSMELEHPVERSRGQPDREDAYSPGWFELPMGDGREVSLTLSAELGAIAVQTLGPFVADRQAANEMAMMRAGLDPNDAFGRQLAVAIQAFVVQRHDAKTVIAGYPWFLDWGRDTFICARGLLAAGMVEEVRQVLITFGRFAANGTLPNVIYGEDASNRDTSDAPLWYGLVAEELAALEGPSAYQIPVDSTGRTLEHVLLDIAAGYCRGTPNGIRMDPETALIWSPSHFTWMDTNYPASTPRQGYPVEIQALWIRLCRQLDRLGVPAVGDTWKTLADRAEASLHDCFWLEEHGYFADLLIAQPGRSAAAAVVDTALRSNSLLAVSLGVLTGAKARACVEAAIRYLIVPGAVRSLAPLPVSPPLTIYSPDGHLLNHPDEPYCGRYEGDEDLRRKVAYHNGTAWTWTFPVFCEALARAWDFDPAAVAAARIYLGSMDRLLTEGCLGHLPEIVDGDAPHTSRGCDAQAWGVTETLRVWKLLQAPQTDY